MPLLSAKHIPAILLALLVAFVHVAPHAYFARSPEYKGIYMAETTDENFYMAAINRSYESPAPIGNPYQYEYASAHNPFQYFAIEFALGKFGAFLGLTIGGLALLMKIVFPFVLTLVIYALSLYLSGSVTTSLLAAAAVMLGNELARPSISDTLRTLMFHGPWVNFMLFERPVNPQVSAIFLFSGILAFLHLLRKPYSKLAIALVGIIVGVLAYVYFFFWAFLAALGGVMAIYALLIRNWRLLASTAIAGAVAIVLSSPFLYAVFSSLTDSSSVLVQAVPTRRIIIEKMVLVPLFLYGLIYAWAWWSSRRRMLRGGEWAMAFARKYVFVLLLLLTGVLVSNQQVITGKLVQQQHFHFFTNIPLFLFAMFLLASESLEFLGGRRLQLLGSGALLILLFWFAAGEQVSSYKAQHATYVRYQALAPLYDWLRARGESVVLSSGYHSVSLAMYTDARTYTSPYDSNFEVPRERLVHDYFVMLSLKGVTGEAVRSYVYEYKNRNEIGYQIFGGLYYRELCGSAACFPDSVLEDLIAGYQVFLEKPLLTRVREYRADYVLWDRKTEPEWRLEGVTAPVPLVESGDFALYAVAP